ncbi:MAG: 2-oxo acid dehydrogenase subunit E2, partial [FCB group bacterium]|nr:2-oxo acid dehydrogenase subunit E2 [FCB group bacterium]
VVEVGKVICTIATEGEVSVKASVPEKKPATAKAPAAKAATAPATPVKASGKKPKMAPAVRKLVREYGLDPAQIAGTGPDGRLTKEDVQKAAAARSSVSSAAASTPAPAAPVKPTPSVPSATTPPPGVPFPSYVPPALGEGDRVEERLPLEGARKMISEHMTRSVQISSHVTTFEDCDFTTLVDYRRANKDRFAAAYGVKLTYMPFIMKAAVDALREFPVLNASMTDTEIILKKYYNIGVAVARENGLIVPVVHNADRLSIIDIAIQLTDLGNRARTEQLTLDEVQGGTFTLTNAGMFGASASTPIINQPQVAILGIHNISEKPVVRDGEIVIRHMSTFGLSFDHRLIDGHVAVQFLHRLIGYLEDPSLLLLRLR